ncbi:MAG: phosphonate ABC transporter, permease protein PhnE [bacterium]|nr:phosphonate ABC transporter, permease protein PhnE [Candidatus Kapabacteria bacterium]
MPKRLFTWGLIALIVAFTVWSVSVTGFNIVAIYQGFFVKPFLRQFIQGMWPLNWTILEEVLYQTLVTIQIAWLGTLIAAVISLPLSFLAARNITPAVAIGISIRSFFNIDRSIDVLIVALIFVTGVGLGPLAGVLAIGIHSIGAMGKLFTEAIESIDRGPIEALESTGASHSQVVRWAVVPQVIPHLISLSLYRLELNIRSSVVLGLVGAGGIGFLLVDNMRQFQYQNVSLILLVITALVMLIDYLSGRLRKSVL